MRSLEPRWLPTLLVLVLLVACGDDPTTPPRDAGEADAASTPDVAPDAPQAVDIGPAPTGTTVAFALDGPFTDPARFYDHPWPSDLRLSADGTPAMQGLPNPQQIDLLAGLLETAVQRPGFPTVPVAWLRFDGPVAARHVSDVIAAGAEQPLLLLDVDPDSPERGRLLPVVAHTLEADDYTAEHVLAVAPMPGVVLVAERTYAFVVRREAGDADGAPLGVPEALWALLHGVAPEGALGDAAAEVFAPLPEALALAGVDVEDVAAATVFTTGDVVAALAATSDALLARHQATLQELAVDPDDGADHARYCELRGTLTLPQFQAGTPPFDSEGLFVRGEDDVPVKQRDETVPITITLPNAPMPADGYPWVLYLHGSGGLSTQLADRGPTAFPGGAPAKGLGPAHVLAAHGFAAATQALPINPERVPGASSIAYLNFANLKMFRDLFAQGVIESRLFIEALTALEIPADTVAACAGLALPAGASAYRFRRDPVLVTGQSMGGMYTNMLAAVEPRIGAAVPTGAGGFWSKMILVTDLLEATPLLKIALDIDQELTHLHPTLHTMQTAWEAADPMVFMPRVGRRPLPGHPARSIYQPAGMGDVYFPTPLYDAYALASGHPQAGQLVWASMQTSLAADGLDGLRAYPLVDNLTSADGAAYTGAVVQYADDGILNAHYIYVQRDEVKYQYGCFLESYSRTGTATLPAPAPLGTPCPGIE